MENKHITINEIFSGIGAQRKALERLGIDHEVVGICEIDKYAIQSYEAIFGKTYNYGDICTAPRLEYADLWTYSFPCQDISVAGKQQGINENTRSGLLYQVQRLLEVAKNEGILPKYLLLENVKNLVGKKFKSQFEDWLFYLEQLGYDSYWQVLNAKNYGIPQNRERVFAISIRKDLKQSFEFPKAEELTIRLKDVLEDEVDEKFYLKDSIVSSFVDKIKCQNKYKPDVINPLKGKTPYGWHFEQAVYDSNGIARAIKAYGGRGITICKEWQDNFINFYNWALANGYNEQAEFMQCTIDRIDVNGNYEPSNCRWVNARVQGDNTRTANRIEYNGEIHCLSEWARVLNIGRKYLYYKLKKGLSFEQIVNESKNKKGG